METKHATSTMPCELYEAEYVTSMTPRCMVKDLVKNRLSKGQTFDEVQPGPEECLCNGPKELFRASALDTASYGIQPCRFTAVSDITS